MGRTFVARLELGSSRRPEPIDLGLRRGQRFTVERGQTPDERIDKRVEVVIVQRAVHPSIALGDISIEIVAAEHDLKCARAADQAREPFQRSAARDQSDADLGVAEEGALPAGEAHVAGQHELVTDAARAAANIGDAHDWRGREARAQSPLAVQGGLSDFWAFRRYFFVEMRDENIWDSPTGTLRPSRTGPPRLSIISAPQIRDRSSGIRNMLIGGPFARR